MPTTFEDIVALLEQQSAGIAQFKATHLQVVKDLEKEILGLKRGRILGGPGRSAGDADPETERKMVEGVRAWVAGDQSKADHLFREAKAMSADSGPGGGYVVHPTVSSGMTKVMVEVSPVYRLSRKVPLEQGDSFEEPVDRAAATASWVGERQTRGDTDTPDLGMLRFDLNEIYAQPKVTQTLIDVASNNPLEWLAGKVGDAFSTAESVAFHSGDGIIKPRGFLSGYTLSSSGDATRTWGQIQYIGTGASGAFPTSSTTVNPADVLVNVVSAMKAQYRNGAVWLMNRTTAGVVRKLKDADGRHVWVDSLQLGQPSVLLGYPVEIDEDMPDISAGSDSIAFANLGKGYTIIERPGVRFLADPRSPT